jgi:NADH-quinone oxidoreductase subunit G
MPKITIDGKTIDVPPGTTIIKAAEELGIYIPRYCYLKALSVVATCRMCLVEVEKAPKLMTACSTPVTDGMVVYTNTEKVRKARQDILEFLLKNHPLDCPICDQAGECFLQDYYMDYGRYKSRFPKNLKIRRPKRRILGKYLVLDNERCILCTRCVRFLKEVTKTSELCVRERGDSSEIDLFQNRLVDNNYTLNLADICPVGAITSADFRFKKRVWFLNTASSICLSCATGCNINVQYANGTIFRLLPRENNKVNGLWMCDTGRLSYKKTLNGSQCVNSGSYKGGKFTVMEYSEVIDNVQKLIRETIKRDDKDSIGVLGSGLLSLEDNFALAELAKNVIGTRFLCMDFPFEQGISDGILINKDPLPDTKGARLIHNAYGGVSLDEFLKALNSGRIQILIVAGNDLGLLNKKINTERVRTIGLYSNFEHIFTDIDYLLPVPSYFALKGLFINYAGIVQKTEPAIKIPEGVKPVWAYVQELSLLLGYDPGLRDAHSVLKKLNERVKNLENIDYDKAGREGIKIEKINETGS